MFIEDHKKYPDDALVASIQFFFGKNGEIKEFSEGFKGEKFGTFNHVTDMIFNFALVNIDLGGILYPKKFFNDSLFFDQDLFMKIAENSDEFWQSAFIIMEDKILRQTSKIFDYTRYLINNDNYEIEKYTNKKNFFEKVKLSFLKQFPNFNNFLEKRQNKIIISVATFTKRFPYLPILVDLLNKQNYHVNKIIFFLSKEDYKYYDLNLKEPEIIAIERDLRPHNKYFHAMTLFRDYAIITLDDDFGYEKRTIESLFNSYVENPNLVSGRRSHKMTYKDNGESNGYYKWNFKQNYIKAPNFDLFLNGCGGIIYPPDILNLNNEILPIINETITGDDITLKYLETIKGIPPKWVENDFLDGIKRNNPQIKVPILESVNRIKNDINIDKLNLLINKTVLYNICAPYRNIQTGLTIYLFDIHNKNKINNKFYFDLMAYSYCPIDYDLNFSIYFDKFIAKCSFNESKIFFSNKTAHKENIKIVNCYMNELEFDPDYYYFPMAISTKENIFIKIYNYKKYLTNIFKSFICQRNNNCVLKMISFTKINKYTFPIFINDKNYSCIIKDNNTFSSNKFPIINTFNCNPSDSPINIDKTFISGLPPNVNINLKKHNDIIPNQFIISRIVVENNGTINQIIFIGKYSKDIDNDSTINVNINFLYPKMTLECNLKLRSKYVQSKIYCNDTNNIIEKKSEILVENQIANSIDNAKELVLLINEETFIKIKHNNIYQEDIINFKICEINSNLRIKISYILMIIFLFVFIWLKKVIKKLQLKKHKLSYERPERTFLNIIYYFK